MDSNSTYTKQLDEPCPDCGQRPISGQFVLLGRFDDPTSMRNKIIASCDTADVRVVGAELHSLIDWTCTNPSCDEKKSYDVSPVLRLARRNRS